MTDKEVEDIIKSNMNLQMNLAGIRADFEEKLQRTWVELTEDEIEMVYALTAKDNRKPKMPPVQIMFARTIQQFLKEKNGC